MKNLKNFGLMFLIVLSLSLTVTSLASASLTSYSNVQISIQTSSNMPSGYYTVTALNMTGYQESSVQTYYPSASFELPNGQYIFTVTAENQTNSIYPIPLASGAASSSGSGATSTGTVSPPSLPVYVAPAVEYGYSVQQVSSSITITIATQNVSSFPTEPLTIQVLYANGTVAADASVSASTVGSSYYWGYESNVVTWTTTNSNGYATLVTPTAPEQINAWSWLPLNLSGVAAPQVIIAGEPVNASGPMIPAYLGLAGSTLIIPPQTTSTITMQTQQQNYWVTPYAATATPETGSTSASSSSSSAGPGAIPASVYAQQQGNPALQATQTSTPTPTPTSAPTTSGNPILLTILVAVVIVAVAVTSLIIATRTKRNRQSSVARVEFP
jgi:hypothetical protein